MATNLYVNKILRGYILRNLAQEHANGPIYRVYGSKFTSSSGAEYVSTFLGTTTDLEEAKEILIQHATIEMLS